MIFGTSVCISPSIREVLGEATAPAPRRSTALVTSLLILLTCGAVWAWQSRAEAQADGSSSLHAGSVTLKNPVEKQLFERLLCMCGDCQRLPLSSCSCSVADDMRAKIRDKMASGVGVQAIQDEYRAEFGARSIAIPSDHGLDRALWAVPITLIASVAGLLIWRGKKWVVRGSGPALATGVAPRALDGYDAALDAELRKLDE
jgi:cytochrome c-type biogenesis protein CcmH/NrfF